MSMRPYTHMCMTTSSYVIPGRTAPSTNVLLILISTSSWSCLIRCSLPTHVTNCRVLYSCIDKGVRTTHGNAVVRKSSAYSSLLYVIDHIYMYTCIYMYRQPQLSVNLRVNTYGNVCISTYTCTSIKLIRVHICTCMSFLQQFP